MPGILHEHAIEQILEMQPSAKRRGFASAVRKDVLEPYQITDSPGGQWLCHIVPDAYLVDHENHVVVAYEVEDASRITTGKMKRYMDLAWEINEPCWTLLLIVVDRWGNMNCVDPMMLFIEEAVLTAKKRAEA